MGRPSKLTPAQWDEIHRRLLAGETASALARAFGVVESAVRKRFGAAREINAKSANVKNAAQMLASAQTALEALPPTQREVAIRLADELREISGNLAAAARYGSATARRLAAVAHAQAAQIDDDAPELARLQQVAALTRTANEAANTGLALLRANEGALQAEEDERERQSRRVTRVELVPMRPEAPES